MSENTKISIDNMNLHYGNFHALKGINMEIPEKEITAFIGPSGCGKSTLLKSLNRMNDLVEGCTITGKVELDGEDIYPARIPGTAEGSTIVKIVRSLPAPSPKLASR